jgi:hypothetical protein
MKHASFVIAFLLLLGPIRALRAEQSWTGQISDGMCGADHSMMAHDNEKLSTHDCTLACVKGGAKYVFVSQGKVYDIQNQDMKDLETHAGHTVRLTGDLSSDGKTIKASKIVMPQGKNP